MTRLRKLIADYRQLIFLGRQVRLVAEGDGFTTEIMGVKIAQCDTYGNIK